MSADLTLAELVAELVCDFSKPVSACWSEAAQGWCLVDELDGEMSARTWMSRELAEAEAREINRLIWNVDF